MCDVDDTVFLHGYDPSDEPNAVDVIFDTTGTSVEWYFGAKEHKFHVVVHKAHVAYLRQKKSEGYKIVMWSRGGSEWAECAATYLGLQAKEDGGDGTVDLCISKPDRYLDDLHAEGFMKQYYIPHVAPNGSETLLTQHGVMTRKAKP